MQTTPLSRSAPLLLVDTVHSGNAWKVRLLAGLLAIPLERRTLSIVDGDLEKPEFASINPWRQVPVLRTAQGLWLAESAAILWYLARNSQMLPQDRDAEADIVRWLAFEQTQHMEFLAQPRLRVTLRNIAKFDDPPIVALRERGTKALQVMEEHLEKQQFFVGGQATIADIALFPYTFMAEQGGYKLSPYPAIEAWLKRIQKLPGFLPLLG